MSTIPDPGRASAFFGALDRTAPTSTTQVFAYRAAPVRVVLIDGEPWFVLADLCKVLGLSNPSVVAQRIDTAALSQTEVSSGGQRRVVSIVNESGMYEVVIRSDKPEAVAFRRWVTGTVLPEIRRTGAYGAPVALPDRKTLAQWVVEAEERAESEARARIEAEARAKELEAPAAAWKHLASAEGDYEVADAAKVLSRDPNISIGRDRLFSFMAAEGWIYRNRASGRWRAYQTQIDNRRLTERFGKPYLHEPSGEMRLGDPTIRVTPKGMVELHKRLGGSGQVAQVAAS
ncbi:antirepressor [Mycobacterium phage KilKor]|uniref:Antirepressor n=3 Tax=Fishburnevirus TaxID=1983734 RepID=A0A6B9T0Q0_9CAUD|nr:anti-repressor Ant [Mycobacterium phage Willsammy]YP_009964289.1 anti-repressor Ant [Mycobacterium phage Megiddo]YP_009964444.1 anti-repressor Ant [Mycobacterium phage Jung]YP_010001335.1 anti-repressor Ant [Mycobacterium phage KilKor]QHB41301.1 antirepressor [Mycobacterium phage Phalm]QHB41458.1 antirepressor [Mycobacterium phage Glaske]QHJ86292.1 antirepressor [Mycobacterium phage CactusJack]QIG57627.1 antirepressor [Mycobacterium phage StressBall]QHB41380.1 antirepressor [Mycobacteriu